MGNIYIEKMKMERAVARKNREIELLKQALREAAAKIRRQCLIMDTQESTIGIMQQNINISNRIIKAKDEALVVYRMRSSN